MARLGPSFWPQIPPEKVCACPFFASFPRKWGTATFFWGPKRGVLGGGEKVYDEKVDVLSRSPIAVFPRPQQAHSPRKPCADTLSSRDPLPLPPFPPKGCMRGRVVPAKTWGPVIESRWKLVFRGVLRPMTLGVAPKSPWTRVGTPPFFSRHGFSHEECSEEFSRNGSCEPWESDVPPKFGDRYDWTTGVPDNGNDWRKFRAVPRSYPLRSLVLYFV